MFLKKYWKMRSACCAKATITCICTCIFLQITSPCLILYLLKIFTGLSHAKSCPEIDLSPELYICRFHQVDWQDVRVGDIMHLSCNDIIPADLLLLKSSDKSGVCHVETMNLDGETNLKQRQCISGIRYGVSHKLWSQSYYSG